MQILTWWDGWISWFKIVNKYVRNVNPMKSHVLLYPKVLSQLHMRLHKINFTNPTTGNFTFCSSKGCPIVQCKKDRWPESKSVSWYNTAASRWIILKMGYKGFEGQKTHLKNEPKLNEEFTCMMTCMFLVPRDLWGPQRSCFCCQSLCVMGLH